MILLKKLFPLLALSLLLAGCSTVTNLTPSRYARKPDNLYHFELQLDSRQQSMRWDSVRAVVVMGKEEFPMERTHRMSTRWEANLPLPEKDSDVYYHFKVYYEYNDFGPAGKDTLVTHPYKLELK